MYIHWVEVGLQDFFFSCQLSFPCSRLSSYILAYFFTLFLSCCSHAWMIGEGRLFVILRLFKSILFFVNWIEFYFFPFLIKYYHIMFIIIVFWLGCDRPSDFFFRARFASFHAHAFLLAFFVYFFVLFRSCCSHAWVFWKTLVHEFPISYSHTEWYLPFPRGEIVCLGRSFVYQNQIKPTMPECLGKHSCTSSRFDIATQNGRFFFRPVKEVLNKFF